VTEILRWLSHNGERQPDDIRWTVADLDRCEHGRHSIDSCFYCPDGHSAGNVFLDPLGAARHTRLDRNQIRIGTMVHGEPIWVTYRRTRD